MRCAPEVVVMTIGGRSGIGEDAQITVEPAGR